MVRVLGCTLALGAMVMVDTVAAGAASVPVPSGSSPSSSQRVVRRLAYVGTIPKSVQREIDTVKTVADLARVSPAARKIIQLPAIEVIESGKASDAPMTYATGSGKAGRGC